MELISTNSEFRQYLESIKLCLYTKHLGMYKKIHGGVQCSELENTKIELALYLLRNAGLECLETTIPDGDLSYLERFKQYLDQYCLDCTPLEVTKKTTNIAFITSSGILLGNGDDLGTENDDIIILE